MELAQLGGNAATDIVGLLGGPVFAIGVAAYLLTRILPALQDLTRAVAAMQQSVDRLNDSVSYVSRVVPQRRFKDTEQHES